MIHVTLTTLWPYGPSTVGLREKEKKKKKQAFGRLTISDQTHMDTAIFVFCVVDLLHVA